MVLSERLTPCPSLRIQTSRPGVCPDIESHARADVNVHSAEVFPTPKAAAADRCDPDPGRRAATMAAETRGRRHRRAPRGGSISKPRGVLLPPTASVTHEWIARLRGGRAYRSA